MNPYDIDYSKLPVSKSITDSKTLTKIKLIAKFIELTKSMETKDVLKITGLDKSDFSRLRIMDHKRFSIDRVIALLDKLGYTISFSLKKKKVS